MKKYVLIAGVNGAGKSTLYQTLSGIKKMPRVNTAEIVKKRVQMRVQRGGHGISESDIERRYIESFKNLKLILNECDLTVFYDNTDKFRHFAIFKGGVPVVLSKKLPEWFQKCRVIADSQEG